MHIPDHYLTTETCWTTAAIAAGSIGLSIGRWKDRAVQGSMSLCGWVAAGVFLAQMADFPVGGGTSGHVLGGALAAILLGPSLGMACMGVVILLQCFLFGDGGVTSLGANLFNMAVLPTLVAWSLAGKIRGGHRSLATNTILAGAAGTMSVLAAVIACSAELSWSSSFHFLDVSAAMLRSHGCVALAEGLFTAGIVGIWLRNFHGLPEGTMTNSTLLANVNRESKARWRWAAFATLATVIIATSFLPEMSDGLGAVARELGFTTSQNAVAWAPFDDYRILGLERQSIGIVAVGLIGAVSVAIASAGCRKALALAKRT